MALLKLNRNTLILASICLAMMVGMFSFVVKKVFWSPVNIPSVRQMLGQKLIIDLRYYCSEHDTSGDCRTPVTTLPEELKVIIRDFNIGGVILFAENLNNTEQIIQLNRDLQSAAQTSELKLPLFISIDQEGGRVARLPRHLSTSFSGNMAIGATYEKYGTTFAEKVGEILAEELLALGINLNFAPTIDVNVNPQNPVINVRAFGESAKQVAELGGAMTHSMQQRGMIAALKHFPGHGDTKVDSHLGLPIVEHSSEHIRKIDLLPFADVIKNHDPGMIMTAHIQYPALDNSTFVSKDGQTMLKPATLSRKILHGVLREDLKYKGVIVTDALDMAGISKFFSHTEAVVQTFSAGADIALMPIKIQRYDDLVSIAKLFDALEAAVYEGDLSATELVASYNRIVELKKKYLLVPSEKSFTAQLKYANQTLGNSAHRQTELMLAKAALTQVKPKTGLWPFKISEVKRILLIMPDQMKAEALSSALQYYSGDRFYIDLISLQQADLSNAAAQIRDADIVISGFVSPMQSLADIGGMDDLTGVYSLELAYKRQVSNYDMLLSHINSHKKTHVFLSLRAPYDISIYGRYADVVLAAYAYNTAENPKAIFGGNATYEALAQAILGQYELTGRLPVTVDGYNY